MSPGSLVRLDDLSYERAPMPVHGGRPMAERAERWLSVVVLALVVAAGLFAVLN